MTDGRRVLYISYTGLMEPLGQSQVLRYLLGLAVSHEITLITYEKPGDLDDTERFESVRETVEEAGIVWRPLRYHRSPSIPATTWDLFNGFRLSRRIISEDDIEIVHARSYIPSVLGLLCKRMYDVGFVFDMRGFWADERVDAGLWEPDSLKYRGVKGLERRFLTEADVVVSLTNAGIEAIAELDYIDKSEIRFEMVPTCVDLELFKPRPSDCEGPFVLGYVGSVGTWYRFDDVLETFELLQEYLSRCRLKIVNRGEHEYIWQRINAFGIDGTHVTVRSVDHAEMPSEINEMDAGVFYITRTFSKKASSPTKLGEYLACGIPCLSNGGVGDVEAILEENGVGIAIDSFDTERKREGIESLLELVEEPSIGARCREVAESHFSLESGIERYDRIYRTVGGR